MARTLRGKPPAQAKTKKAKVLVFGEGGVGKTWTSLDFPDCYYIDAEGGATRDQYTEKLEKSGALYLGQEDGAGDLSTVVQEVQTLAMTQHDRRTLVIDSYSKLFNSAIAFEEERLTEAKEKMAFGNQKAPAVKATRRLVYWLDKIDMNVILICHQKALWKGGEQIGDTFDGWDKLNYELDLTIQVVKNGGERRGIVRKSRLEGFEDGSNFPWSYEEFAARYGRDDIEGEVVSLEPSTPEQLQQLTTLLDAVKMEEETLVKWREKAGVDTWDQMDSVTMEKCVIALKKKVGK